MLRALLQARSQLAAEAGRLGAARLMSSAAESPAAPAKSSSLRNFFLALIPIGVLGAVFEKKHLDSLAETEAREAAERAAGHTPARRATASGGRTSHGVEIDPNNPLNKILPDTDCEYCLETRQKIYDMFKHMGHKEAKRPPPKAGAAVPSAAPELASQAEAATPASKPAAAGTQLAAAGQAAAGAADATAAPVKAPEAAAPAAHAAAAEQAEAPAAGRSVEAQVEWQAAAAPVVDPGSAAPQAAAASPQQ